MRCSICCLALTIFVATATAQEAEKFVPIMSPYYLIGGSQNGKWLTAETLAPQMKKPFQLQTLGLKGVGKNGFTVTNTGEGFGACPENMIFKFDPEIEGAVDWSVAVGEGAKWNFIPRVPKSIAVTDQTYRRIAADFLRTKGIARSKINLSQILQVDLEGDGQIETLITGNFYKKGLTEMQSVGDYSFALVRKIVNGRAKNILIEGEFFTKKDDYAPPNEREISVVADLNGDGVMEILLSTSYYEGTWEQVFEMKNGKPVKVLEVSCLV